MPLTVTANGTFLIQGGPPRGKKIPVIAALTLKDEAGKIVVAETHDEITRDLAPGKYVVNIKDSIPGDAAHFKGGFSFELSIRRTALLAPSASGSAGAGARAMATAVTSVSAATLKPTAKAANAGGKVAPGAKDAGAPPSAAVNH